jgi:hypothetical protein
MAWKKSNDGGIDYEVEELIEIHKREQQPKEFNPFATAHTVTFNFNLEEIPTPKSRKEEIQKRLKEFRKRKYGL